MSSALLISGQLADIRRAINGCCHGFRSTVQWTRSGFRSRHLFRTLPSNSEQRTSGEITWSRLREGESHQTAHERYPNIVHQLIEQVKHSSEMVRQLPPDLQRPVRDSYAIALQAVFTLAACCTVLAFLVRLPVRLFLKGGPFLTYYRFPNYRWMKAMTRPTIRPLKNRTATRI